MLGIVDPKEFIITRKRKKYKFALFHNSPLCFEVSEWDNTFSVDVVEVGAGNGKFAVELAIRHPEQQFVALDVKADRLQHGARIAEEKGITNIHFLRARADQLDELFLPDSIASIWVTFPDPFPKKRSAGRRLMHPTFLKKYASVLKNSGGLYLKHDSCDFFCWSLEQLVAEQWQMRELSFDLHESTLPDNYKILTSYEQRWLGEGRITQFARVTKIIEEETK